MHGFVYSYLQAGADMIETPTYQASIVGFMKHLSVTSSEAEQLLREAVSLSLTARNNFWQDPSSHAGRTLCFVENKSSNCRRENTWVNITYCLFCDCSLVKIKSADD